MAELVVTTSLDRSGFDKGVAEITTAIAQISAKPIKVKIDGDFSKITADVAKVAVAQEKTKQAIEATKQAQISANAAMAASAAKVAVAQEQVNLAHEKGAQAAATAAGKVAVQQEKTATEAEKTAGKVAQANARIVAAQGRVSAEEQKTQQQIEKTAQQHERTAQAAIRAGAQHEAAARRAATATDQLANSVNRVSEAFSGWVTRNIWMALRNGLRDALNTMREMDTQLTTIRRVSGMSEAEVGKYQEQAYDISSKYGVKPADYLSNVVAYTRAGYGNLSGELAEVTTKLQVVGQVSQDVATQMLLAVDAAYQFEDRTQGLSSVMDGVVAIGDHYATNVEKIAEAIGVVAPIAAQAHVGIDELAAAIGTITADTQRSGTEAARALRYVFLNILQNTTTEIEEGVTLTKEEIEGFQDVLEYFIPDVLALAEAEGKVINPMEALGALAKGVKEDVIDEAQLFEMLTKVAGKLRASQVLALVNDWDKYSDMVKLFGDSLGETDSKVEVALSSWESKANMLSASFTKMFGNVLNSSMVKGGLDILKNLVDFMNIGDGVPAKMVAVGAALSTVFSIISSFAAGGTIAKTISMLTSFFANPAFLTGAAIVGVVAAIKELVVSQADLEKNAESTSQSYNEQKSKLDQITSELEEHKKIVAELEGKSGSLTTAEQARLDKEREITAELERQAVLEEYKTDKAWREAAVAASAAGLGSKANIEGIKTGYYAETPALTLDTAEGISGHIVLYDRAKKALEESQKGYNEAISQGNMELALEIAEDISDYEEIVTSQRDAIAEYLDKNETYYKLASDYAEKNGLMSKAVLTTEQEQIVNFVKYYKTFLDYMETNFPELISGASTTGGEAGTSGTGGTDGAAAATQTAWQKAQEQQLKRTQALIKANKEYNDTLQTGQKFARISQEVYDDLTDAGVDLKDAVIQDGKEFIITREALDGFIKSSKEWYENYGLEMPDNFKEIAESAETVADSFEELLKSAGGMADEVAGASKALADLKAQLKSGGEQGDTLKAYREEYKAVMELYGKGFYGSRELQGFFNLMFGEEQMAAWGWDYEKAGKIAGTNFFKAMFNPDDKEDIGQQAVRYLADSVADKKTGDILYNGEVVANLKRVNGEIKITINSFEGLAGKLGINTDVLLTLFDSLGLVQKGLNNTGTDVKNLVDGLGDLSTNADQASKRLAQVEGDKRFHKGNVGRDASGRPKVKLTAEQAEEWGGQAGETATVLSQAWSYGEGESGYTIVFTPIFKGEDGNPVVMSKDGVAKYLEETLGAGSKTLEEVLAADADGLGIIQGIVEGTGKESVQLAEAYGQLKHELHDVQLSSEGTLSNTIDMDKLINKLAMEGKNAQEIFGLINSIKQKGEYDFYGDSATESDLISRIQQAVANANNKDLQLKPDASGWVSYQAEATSAIQTVEDKWSASSGTINGTAPKPSVDTGDLENAITEVDGATKAVEELGSADGTGKAGMETGGVPEGTEEVKGAGEALEDYNGAEGTGTADMDTGGLVGKPEEVDDAGEALEDYDGSQGSGEADMDTDGLKGKDKDVENAGKALKDYNGSKGKGTAYLDIKDLDPGKDLLNNLIQLLHQWGVIDESAKAKLQADLDDPEARIKVAQALLVAFADTPGEAEAGVDTRKIYDGLPTVGEAKETLKEFGVDYNAVVGLEDNVPPTKLAEVEGLLLSLLGLDKTFQAKLVFDNENASIQEQAEAAEKLRNELNSLREIAADRQAGYDALGVDTSALKKAQEEILDFQYDATRISASLSFVIDCDADTEEAKAKVNDLLGDVERAKNRIDINYHVSGAEDVEQASFALRNEIEGVPVEHETTFKVEGDKKARQLAKRVADEIRGIPVAGETDLVATDNATSVIKAVGDALTGLNGKGATVHINAQFGGTSSTVGPRFGDRSTISSGNSNITWSPGMSPTAPAGFKDDVFSAMQAEGTRDFPGGRSLVNELGPELIAYGGKAFVAGGGYPTIVNLPKGAMIFDAAETRSIVANSGGLPSGVIGSHAGGVNSAYAAESGLVGIGRISDSLRGKIDKEWEGVIPDYRKDRKKGKGGGGPAVDNTDYWAIVEAHYKEITAVADNAATNLEYQIKLLKDAWDDEKKPLDEQIKALQDLNGIIDRQITLLTRERDKLTKPIQDEVDALKEAKDIQDDQLELEERQKAVEEARAELQNAQNERTIRFYNKETGHWEWMADQKRVQDAQKALEDAQKSLADFEYDQRIKALEAEIKAIEDEYQDKFDKLNEDKQDNEDTIYDLNQQLKDLERKYNELIGPLEEEKEDRARAKEAAENAWTNAQFERREAPKGNLDLAISKTGVPGSIAGGGIKELQADLKTIANAYKGSQQNNTLASLGIQFGATPSYAGTSSVTTVGNNVTDSHDIVINGITLPASAAYQSLMDLANDLSIYVNYK